ncbi:MAG: L,D-transpeptidase [Flavipsychrobacter sp.]
MKAQNSDFNRPKNLKLVREYDDGKGHIVREVQYSQGNMRVTETIIMPKPRRHTIGFHVRVNPDTLDTDSLWLIIDKSRYVLQVYYKNRMLRNYRAVFGPKPILNKCMEGDRCTPEGWFTIVNKHKSSKYNKFLGISYPGAKDIERFNELKKKGSIPKNARIGGNIGIHGIWEGGDDMIELGVGWTDGCIALKNKDVNDLYLLIKEGVRVYIQK